MDKLQLGMGVVLVSSIDGAVMLTGVFLSYDGCEGCMVLTAGKVQRWNKAWTREVGFNKAQTREAGVTTTPARPSAAALAEALMTLLQTADAFRDAVRNVPEYTGQHTEAHFYAVEQEAYNRACDVYEDAVNGWHPALPPRQTTDDSTEEGMRLLSAEEQAASDDPFVRAAAQEPGLTGVWTPDEASNDTDDGLFRAHPSASQGSCMSCAYSDGDSPQVLVFCLGGFQARLCREHAHQLTKLLRKF